MEDRKGEKSKEGMVGCMEDGDSRAMGDGEECCDDLEGDGAVSIRLCNRGVWWFGDVGGGREGGEEDGESDLGSEEEYGE